MLHKTFIMAVVIFFALFMVLVPVQEVQAACSDAALKAAITSALALSGLTFMDCLLTGCTMTLFWLALSQGIPLAALLACLDAWLWGNSPPQSPTR